MSHTPKNRVDAESSIMFVYGLIAFWFILALTMGALGLYVSSPNKPPIALGVTCILPILFFVIAYLRRGAVWRVAHALDLRLIVLAHVFRIVGIDFILRAAEGRLPMGFALPAGIGDIITGVSAIPIAWGISRTINSIEKWFVVWNIFGLIDLVVAVSLGILHSGSTLSILTGSGPSTLLMAQLPRSLVPTFLVPLYILLHLLSLSRRNEVAKPRSNQTSGTGIPCPILRAIVGG